MTYVDWNGREQEDPEGATMPATDGRCESCGHNLLDHLSADECEAHGIDAGLRDGLGCAVVIRVDGPR